MVVKVHTEIIEAGILEDLEPKVESIEAEIVEDLSEPIEIPEPWAKRRKRKKPHGTRVKDYPDFTTKTREKILNAARLGMPVDFNAYFAGVHPKKLNLWLQHGIDAKAKLDSGLRLSKVEKHFAEFDTEYQRATVQPIAVLLQNAFRAALDDGPTAIKLLEKIAPTQYGPKSQGPTVITQIAVDQRQGLTDGTSEVYKKLSTGTLRELRAMKRKQLTAGDEDEETDK
jgi:hypothetical protein